MKKNKIYIILLSVMAMGLACTTTRKSAKYYEDNKSAISELRNYFEVLYQQQPFAAGFSDKSLKYYVMQIVTDSLRSIYTNDKREKEIWDKVYKFNYDTVLLKKMAAKMKEVKCLWIGKSAYYIDEQKLPFTSISFGSALIEKPFVEDKYYILIFLEKKLEHPELEDRVKKGKLVPVDDLVYYTIGSSYR